VVPTWMGKIPGPKLRFFCVIWRLADHDLLSEKLLRGKRLPLAGRVHPPSRDRLDNGNLCRARHLLGKFDPAFNALRRNALADERESNSQNKREERSCMQPSLLSENGAKQWPDYLATGASVNGAFRS